MVTSGTQVNDRCCFDYGNAETNTLDTGNGHMEAINFGTECWFWPYSGPGPRVQADLENGLFAGGNGSWVPNTGRNSDFVTTVLKNNGTTTYAIKEGNAQTGALTTRYDGPLPNLGGYTPVRLGGGIVLGTGGDDSNGSVGSFFEGVMTAGYITDAAENAVQANVVSVAYQAVPSFAPTAGQTYAVTNVNGGKAIGAEGCATGNRTLVDTSTPTGADCQKWAFNAAPDGTWTISNVNSGKVMDAYFFGQGDGTSRRPLHLTGIQVKTTGGHPGRRKPLRAGGREQRRGPRGGQLWPGRRYPRRPVAVARQHLQGMGHHPFFLSRCARPAQAARRPPGGRHRPW